MQTEMFKASSNYIWPTGLSYEHCLTLQQTANTRIKQTATLNKQSAA